MQGGVCQPCFKSCKACTGPSSCSECLLGYYYEPSSVTCQPCSLPNSLACTSANLIMTCRHSFFLSANSCFACRPNCLSCVDSLSCQECALGFVILINAGQYCKICPDRCTSCQKGNTSLCTSCLVGYTLNSSQGCSAIASCVANCTLCITAGSCSLCAEGYFLTLTGGCLQSNLKISALCAGNAYGNRYYQCIGCQSFAYNPVASQNSQLCLPRYSTNDGISRYRFIDAEINSGQFTLGMLTRNCGPLAVNYIPSNMMGLVPVTFTLDPYYRITVRAKVFLT